MKKKKSKGISLKEWARLTEQELKGELTPEQKEMLEEENLEFKAIGEEMGLKIKKSRGNIVALPSKKKKPNKLTEAPKTQPKKKKKRHWFSR